MIFRNFNGTAVKTYITSLFKEKTSNVDPGTSTDLANSLDLLSSGIYTEEERFIFELLQNAVDAYSNNAELNIRILIEDEYIIFMHNGASFSKRDIEGICSVGNGNKTNDLFLCACVNNANTEMRFFLKCNDASHVSKI